jgi:hypothetical protein
MKKVLSLTAALVVVACSSGGYPETQPSPNVSPNAPIGWPVQTAEYVDLWFHGYAMVMNDTAKVPLFDRGYRDRMTERRRQLNVTTALDANMQTLRDGLSKSSSIEGSGQFVIFRFASLDELARVTKLFYEGEGSPTTVNDNTTRELFTVLRSGFRTVAERDWLRLFVNSLVDENSKFYQSYWNAQQVDRGPTRTALTNAWNNTYKAKYQRYLRNERLVDGTFVLSLPIGGEGRTYLDPQMGNAVAASFPEAGGDQMSPLYTFTHEIVGSAASRAIEDNLTPAQAREGMLAKLTPIGAVRAGAILLQRIAPELLQGYQRFYLRQTGAAVPSGDPNAAFIAAFDLPQEVADGIARQIDLVLAGI